MSSTHLGPYDERDEIRARNLGSAMAEMEMVKVLNNEFEPTSERPLVSNVGVRPPQKPKGKHGRLYTMFRCLFHSFMMTPFPCKGLALPAKPIDNHSLGNKVTGTLYGYRKGHVHFAMQEDPASLPVLLLELGIPTNMLVKEMASGLVRIALECERTHNRGKLFYEPFWTMYCNGRKTGYAMPRVCSDTDMQVLSLVKAVSMGAGVLPTEEEGPDGELMFMRARFERVVGSRDSEAFYMMNPDGSGGPELSVFLLRI